MDEGLNIEYCFARQVEYLYVKEKEKAEDLYNRAIHLTRNGIIWEKAKESVGLERIEEEYDLRK